MFQAKSSITYRLLLVALIRLQFGKINPFFAIQILFRKVPLSHFTVRGLTTFNYISVKNFRNPQ